MRVRPSFAKTDRYKVSSYQTYNQRAPARYDRSIYLKLFQVDRWDRAIVQEVPPPREEARVLDVGCATGRLLRRMAEGGVRNLCGVDLAPRIVEVARRKLGETDAAADIRVADAEENLPWPADSFDLVTMTGVLHHFFRPREALAEVRRVLRAGGKILVAEPWFPSVACQLINAALLRFSHEGDYRFYHPREAIRLIQNTGWTRADYRKVARLSFLVTAT
jgi:ubiquinone/menaquinone biosynthesis C-methylase UbiE